MQRLYFEPEMWIDLKDNNTGISITNISDDGRTFSLLDYLN